MDLRSENNIRRRIFLAIPVPQAYRDYLNELKYINPSFSKIKWMRLHNLHVTVFFIGSIPSADFEKVASLIPQITGAASPFELKPEKLWLMPEHKPRMIWVRFLKNEMFSSIYKKTYAVLEKKLQHITLDYTDPVPHITLARFHPLKSLTGVKYPDYSSLPGIPVSQVELWESVKTAKGRNDYISRKTFPL